MKSPIFVLVTILLLTAGCKAEFQDRLDAFEASAKITYSDGQTGIEEFPFVYTAIFEVRRGSKSALITRTFAGPTALDGLTVWDVEFTDQNGDWEVSTPDLSLSANFDGEECFSVCTTNSCNSTSRKCFDTLKAAPFNVENIVDVQTMISYKYNGLPVSTYGVADRSELVKDRGGNTFYSREDLFVTPLDSILGTIDKEFIVIDLADGRKAKTVFKDMTPRPVSEAEMSTEEKAYVAEALQVLSN